MHDGKSSIVRKISQNTTALSSAGTTTGNIIDRQGYDKVTFVNETGPTMTGAQTLTPVLYAGNDPALADAVAVTEAELIGGVPTTEGTTSGALANAALAAANSLGSYGYLGIKRYLRQDTVAAGTVTASTISGHVELGRPSLI